MTEPMLDDVDMKLAMLHLRIQFDDLERHIQANHDLMTRLYVQIEMVAARLD